MSDDYAEWLQRELAIGLKEADDPNADSFTAEEVDEYMRLKKEAFLRDSYEKAS